MASETPVETPIETPVGHRASKRRQAAAPKARSHHLVIAGGAIAALLAALLCMGALPRIEQRKALLEAASAVKTSLPVVAVARPQLAGAASITLPGSVQAFEDTVIYARTNGYLEKRLVDIGDAVKAGDLLAQISTPEADQQLNQAKAQLAQAYANLEQTKAKLNQAQRDWDRAQKLGPSDALSQTGYDAYQSGYETAKASVDAAEAAIASSKANVQQLTDIQGFQKVTAPFDGVITQRHVDVGALISAGSSSSAASLFRLSQLDVLRVFASVPQSSVPSIHVSQEATITVREHPDRKFKGKVARTASSLDPATRTLLTEVDVPNPDLALLPGMYVQVDFDVKAPGNQWRIPAGTMVFGSQGTRVAVITPENTVHYQDVTVARDFGSEIMIASGLEGNETLVRTPSAALVEGTKVQIATNR